MKRIKFGSTFLFCALSTMSISAEESYIAPLAQESLLLDIAKTEDQYIAVGERGHVLRSTDGDNWQQESTPTLSTLTAITTHSGKSWAVGHDAVIIHQSSKDKPWEVQRFSPELEKPLLDVHFINDKMGIAIGAYGVYMTTEDSGQNWTQVVHSQFLQPDDLLYLEEIRLEDESFYQSELVSILPHLNRITQVGNTLYIAGESGLIAKSSDFGQSWERMEVTYFGSFFDIQALDDGQVVAVGLRGNIYQLADQNSRWVAIDSGITASLNSIVPLDGGEFLAIGNSGYVVCVNAGKVATYHYDDGKALNAALYSQNHVVAVSAVGAKKFAYQAQQTECERIGESL
ncbi:YCF48-related protein [Aliiglaciecola sp.]|nr:YCF48-related protein [Aliiglaciecola sp.]